MTPDVPSVMSVGMQTLLSEFLVIFKDYPLFCNEVLLMNVG